MCLENTVGGSRALLYRALLQMCRALLQMCRALLWMQWALLMRMYLALLRRHCVFGKPRTPRGFPWVKRVRSHNSWNQFVHGDFLSCVTLKLHDSFAKEPCKRGDILQKRPMFLKSLPIVAALRLVDSLEM